MMSVAQRRKGSLKPAEAVQRYRRPKEKVSRRYTFDLGSSLDPIAASQS